MAAAQKATSPRKPEHLSWAELREGWRADARGFGVGSRRANRGAARAEAAGTAPRRGWRALGCWWIGARLRRGGALDKAAFTRADLVEVIGAQLPLITDRDTPSATGGRWMRRCRGRRGALMPRRAIDAAVDAVGVRLTGRGPRTNGKARSGSRCRTCFWPRKPRYSSWSMRPMCGRRCWVRDDTTLKGCRRIRRGGARDRRTEHLVRPLSAPAGAGKTTSMRALRTLAKHRHRRE